MSRIFTSFLRQKAVYWSPTGKDIHGATTFGTAEEIFSRWEDNNDQYLDNQGNVVVASGKVFVDRDVDLGGMLRLGALADVPNVNDPRDPANGKTWTIMRLMFTPSIKASETVRIVML